jgi:hypothetical protein
MKARSLKSSAAVAVVVALMAALPAHAGSGLTKVTHSSTTYTSGVQSLPSTVAKAKTTSKPAATPEFQVAIMAKTPLRAPPRRAVFIHR